MNFIRLCLSLVIASTLAGPGQATRDDTTLAAEIAELVRSVAEPHGPGATPAPGGVLGVLRRGQPIAVQAFGMAELGAKRPITIDTAFYIASTAKQFTAACVAHAADAGRLSLDDSITKRVSGLPDAYRPVTLRHMLNQRSGIKDFYEAAIYLDVGPAILASNAAALQLVRQFPDLDFAPGERCMYSNSGYLLLAEALHGVAGKTLGAYARENLFGPLKMEHAHYTGEPAARPGDDARSYRANGESFEPIEVATGLTGPGGMWASFSDLARWDGAWATQQFGSEKLRQTLLTPPKLASGQSLHPLFGPYAGGLMVGAWRGLRAVRHAGGAFGFSAELMRFPDQGISVIALSNHQGLDARKLAESAAEIALRDKLAPEPTTQAASESSPTALARFGRMWRDERSGVVWSLTLKPDRKVVATLGDIKFDVSVTSASRLSSVRSQAPVTLDFEPAEGAATRMLVRIGDVQFASCRPIPFPPSEPPPASDYEGEYRSVATGSTVSFRADGANLVLVQERPILPFAPFVLPPFHAFGEDLFVCDAGGQVQFTRDAEGGVTGARLDISRARGLMLERR